MTAIHHKNDCPNRHHSLSGHPRLLAAHGKPPDINIVFKLPPFCRLVNRPSEVLRYCMLAEALLRRFGIGRVKGVSFYRFALY